MAAPDLGDLIDFTPDTDLTVESLVKAIVDALDPAKLRVSHRLVYRRDEVQPIILVRLNAAQWELSVGAWARAYGELTLWARWRPVAAPRLEPVLQRLLAGCMEALNHADVPIVRGAL